MPAQHIHFRINPFVFYMLPGRVTAQKETVTPTETSRDVKFCFISEDNRTLSHQWKQHDFASLLRTIRLCISEDYTTLPHKWRQLDFTSSVNTTRLCLISKNNTNLPHQWREHDFASSLKIIQFCNSEDYTTLPHGCRWYDFASSVKRTRLCLIIENNNGGFTRGGTRHFFNNSETNKDIATKF
jgi:hypothetical protein